MEKDKDLLDWDNLTREQKRRLDELAIELRYLNEEQGWAIDGCIPMTQAIYDSIMERREEVGPILESVCIKLCLEYPDFAEVYTDRVWGPIELSDDELEEESPEEKKQAWERLKERIREKYGDVI